MSTPHNRAKKGDFAKVCIMPGDPLRAKWIAETFLDNAVLVNDVRGMLGFTGYYKGKRVSVMAHGMGIPSIGIYVYELFKFYDVDYIIRVGSAGALVKNIKVGSVFLVKDSYTKSVYPQELGVKTKSHIFKPSKKLLDLAIDTCHKFKIPYHLGRVYSDECFYGRASVKERIKDSGGAQMCEMESAGLFATADKLKKQAMTLLTCSDNLVTHELMSSYERQTKFKDMVKLSLEMAIKLVK